MKNKKGVLRLLIFSVAVAMSSLMLCVVPDLGNFCGLGGSEGIFRFLTDFSIASVFVSLIFLLVRGDAVFGVWKKFAMISLPFFAILTIVFPEGSVVFSLIFFFVSLGIILQKREKHSPLDLHEC